MITSRLFDIAENRECLTTAQARAQANFSNAYLTQLLRAGVLEGFKIERDWFIYSDSLGSFLAKERKPGPRPTRKGVA